MRPGHARHRGLGEIVEGRVPIAVRVVLGGAVRHFDQQAARLLDEQGQCVVRGDQMRIDAEPQKSKTVLEIVVPDRLVPFEQFLAAPDVADEDVEAAVLGSNALNEPADIVGDQMVDAERDAAAAGRRDQLRRLLDGLGPLIFGGLAADRAARHVDGRAGGAEFHSDAAPGAAGSACHQGDLARERHRSRPMTPRPTSAPISCRRRP
jgi:hypothetical protein